MIQRKTWLAGALAVLCAALPGAVAAQKIVIDAGHGGRDPGGTGTGMQEKVIVLDVSTRFKALLDADTADTAGGGSWTALMTRSDDTFVSLAGRAAYANNQGADRFMSIHSNAFGDASANGTETFSYTANGQGAALRNLVQEEMIAAWGLTNRGNKTASFAVLRETSMPAELHELAFITNAVDAQKLGSPEERQKAAVAHLRAIQRHYNVTPYLPGDPVAGETGEVAGAVVDELGPVAGATVSFDSGQVVTTGDDGTFEVAGVPAGTRGLTVTAAGHDDTVEQVEVDAGQKAEASIFLERATDGPDDEEGGAPGADDSDGGRITAGWGCRASGGGLSGGSGSALLLLLSLLGSASLRRRAL